MGANKGSQPESALPMHGYMHAGMLSDPWGSHGGKSWHPDASICICKGLQNVLRKLPNTTINISSISKQFQQSDQQAQVNWGDLVLLPNNSFGARGVVGREIAVRLNRSSNNNKSTEVSRIPQ
jgi:hypothetical protein